MREEGSERIKNMSLNEIIDERLRKPEFSQDTGQYKGMKVRLQEGAILPKGYSLNDAMLGGRSSQQAPLNRIVYFPQSAAIVQNTENVEGDISQSNSSVTNNYNLHQKIVTPNPHRTAADEFARLTNEQTNLATLS